MTTKTRASKAKSDVIDAEVIDATPAAPTPTPDRMEAVPSTRVCRAIGKAEDGEDLTTQEALELAIWMTDWLRSDGAVRTAEQQQWLTFRAAIHKAAGSQVPA